MDRPLDGRFLGLTAFQADGSGDALQAQMITSVTYLPSRPYRHSDPGRRILVHVDSDTY